MDPGTGNIYTRKQAEALGLDFDDLVPLEDDEAVNEMRRRSAKVEALAKRKRKAAKKARRKNRR